MGTTKRTYIRDGRAPIPRSENISRVMSANRGKDTGPEILLRRALREKGFNGYRLHWKKAPGRPDITYPGKKIAIFVNGCFWHGCGRHAKRTPKTNKKFWLQKIEVNKKRDKKKTARLRRVGWSVYTIWEHDVKKENFKPLFSWLKGEMRKRA